MRRLSWLVLNILLGTSLCAAAAPSASRKPKPPYDGLWASSPKMCRDREGTHKMQVSGDRFTWYETRCRAHDIKAIDARSWTMRMSCEGEGEKFSVKPRLLLPTPNKLIFADQPPVGTAKRERFVRCEQARGR